MADLAGRSYISKLYRISKSRTPVVDLLLKGIEDGGGRVVSCSFPAKKLAPIFIGAEDRDNHRFGLAVAVRGSVAEHHLGNLLDGDQCIAAYESIDQDGMPDFRVWLDDGRELTIECKNALSETYKDGDAKVETQKTRDSGAGRKYAYDAFDVVAACMFPVTKRWAFKFKWARDLTPWIKDNTKVGAIQRIDDTWGGSLDELLQSET